VWEGDPNQPMSYNAWLYVYGNPVNLTDPSGLCVDQDSDGICDWEPRPQPPSPPSVCSTLARVVDSNDDWDCFIQVCSSALADSEHWRRLGKYRISAYYIAEEAGFSSGATSPIMLKDGSFLHRIGSNQNVRANEYFLFSDAGVCMQGTGRLRDGRYIGCTRRVNWTVPDGGYRMPPDADRAAIWFADKTSPPVLTPFKNVARWTGSSLTLPIGTKLFAPDLVPFLRHWDKPGFTNGMLTVRDVGGGLGPRQGEAGALDLFVGYQTQHGYEAYQDLKNCSTAWPDSDYYNRHPEVCLARPPFPLYIDVYKWIP